MRNLTKREDLQIQPKSVFCIYSILITLLIGNLPFTALGDEPTEGQLDSTELSNARDFGLSGSSGSSASATFYTGEVDRGQIHLPIKNDFSGTFANAGVDPSLGDANFHGWQGDVKVPTGDLGINTNLNDAKFVFQWDWGKSSFQSGAFDINTSSTNATNSLLLDPQGTNGGFGNTGYIAFNNSQYFADHQNVWASSSYEEQLYAFGIEKVCLSEEQLLIESMLAFILGNTKEESVIAGQTGIIGGMGGTPSVDYRYENELDTTRFGLQLGVSVKYDLGEIGGRSVGLYADGQARYIYNDAEATSSARVRGLVNYDSVNNNIEGQWSDFGLVGGAGVEVELCEDATFTAGVQVESWSIGDLGTPVGESFVVREDDRITMSAGFGVRFEF